MSFIELIDVYKSFGENKVLRGINLSIEMGESLVILGKSGIGKSVTLLVLTRLLPLDEGRVIINGIDTTKLSEDELIPIRKKISYVFQSGALFDSLTVYENISFPMVGEGLDEDEIEEKTFEIMNLLGIKDFWAMYPDEISSGTKKIVSIGRALAASPDCILYDEPTTGIDPYSAKKLSEVIRRINLEMGITSILVTHDMRCAKIVADKIAFLHDGKIYFHDTFNAFVESELPVLVEFKTSLPYMAEYLKKG